MSRADRPRGGAQITRATAAGCETVGGHTDRRLGELSASTAVTARVASVDA